MATRYLPGLIAPVPTLITPAGKWLPCLYCQWAIVMCPRDCDCAGHVRHMTSIRSTRVPGRSDFHSCGLGQPQQATLPHGEFLELVLTSNDPGLIWRDDTGLIRPTWTAVELVFSAEVGA